MLSSQSAKEFSSVRRKAYFQEWLNYLTGRPNDLLSFEEVKQNLRLQDSAYRGLQEVELDKIVGSTGRYRDFNRSFLPKTDQTEDRWRRVDAVAHNEGYPPIDLYKVGDVYFVRDGNHRVSVARSHEAKTIESYVIEYKSPVPIDKEDELDDILLRWERADFFKETKLDEIRPEQNVEFTEPGRYHLVKEHIGFHKFLREVECGCEISYEEAVASWYDNVYRPVIERIQESKILEEFPERTEADLYAWLLQHRAALEKETDALGHVPGEELLEKIKRERATNPFARLMGLFRNEMELKTLPLKVEQTKFLADTRLDEIKPEHEVECTEPGCYQVLNEHINVHKYLKETESSHELSYEEAVASWYDNVYLPVIELIRKREMLDHFTDNTETDIYIWLVSRRKTLEEERQARVPTEEIIDELEAEALASPITKLVQYFRDKLHLQNVTGDAEENGEAEE